MIYEFAVDPAVAAGWHDRSDYRFFKGAFGVGKRRVLSCYPGAKWKRMVMDEFHELFRNRDPVEKQNAKKKIDALLHHLTEASSSRNQPCAVPWVESALREHQRRNFQGILVAGAGNDGPLINAAEVDDDDPRWNPGDGRADRSAGAFTLALTPLLRHARRLAFVDPYLEPADTRFSAVLTQVLGVAQQGRTIDERIRLAVHTSVDREFTRDRIQTDEAEMREADQLVSRIRDMLRPKLDPGASLSVTIWSSNKVTVRTEVVHNRYVLCERGGVMFGHGLDAGDGRETLSLLTAFAFREVEEVYGGTSTALRRLRHEEFTSL